MKKFKKLLSIMSLRVLLITNIVSVSAAERQTAKVDSIEEVNPIIVAKGVDENGKEFEQKIAINDMNLLSARIVEMRTLEAHCNVDKGGSRIFLPKGTENMGLNDRRNFISMFEEVI